MKILTPSGYKNISDMNIGDEIIGRNQQLNKLTGKTLVHKDMFGDELGFEFYLINGRYKLFCNQSIYVNNVVSHVFLIKKGDVIFDSTGQSILITSIEKTKSDLRWERLDISGDHSYISDDILLHNASRFLVGGGSGNWNNNNNWSATDGGASGASFPVNGDAVTFNTNSGATNMTVNVASACTSIVCTATYTGTLTFNATLTVAGTVTFIAGMTIAGTSDLIVNATATLTSAGKTLTGGLQITGGTITITLADTWTITGTFTTNSNSKTINGNTLNVGGGMSIGVTSTTVSGTTSIVMNGTGTVSFPAYTSGELKNNLTFNTAGTITISGTFSYNTGTITYTAGTMVTSASTFTNSSAGAVTINTSGMSWLNLILGGAFTMTLSSDMTCTGSVTLHASAGTGTCTINGFKIFCGTTLSNRASTGIVTGTTVIEMNGTGSVTNPSITTGTLRNSLIFNTAGTITISTTIRYQTGTITYTAGTMSMGSSVLNLISTTTLATSGMTWNDITIETGLTITLSSACALSGILTTAGTTTINTSALTGVSWTAGTSTLSGSSNVTFTGGTITGTAITINKTNTITYAGSLTWTVTTHTWTAGTVTTTGSTLTMSGSRTFAGATTWNNWTTSGTGTLTTNALQTLAGTMTVGGGFTTTFAGTNGVLSCANLTLGASSTLVIPTNATVTSTTTINVSGSVINGAFTLNTGGLTMSGNLTGTLSLINFNATGTWSGSGVVIHNTTVNTAGTLTISGTVHYKTGTFTYTAGTVTVTSSTLSIDGSCTFAGALTWNNWTVAIASTVTINSLQTLSGTLTLQVTTIFAGTNGWTTNSFVCTTAGLTHTFKDAITYTTTGTMMMVGTPKNKIKFISASTPTKAILTFTNPQTVYYVSPTDIDSSAGNPVATLGGTITNTLNWNNILHPAIVTITG